MRFESDLEKGKAAESLIAKWLRNRGWTLFPSYEKLIDDFKGPRIFCPGEEVISPDFLVFKLGKTFWVEVKDKAGWGWRYTHQIFTMGIDKYKWEHYKKIEEATEHQVHFLFYSEGEKTKNCPFDITPSGLFWGALATMKYTIDHESPSTAKEQMFFWDKKDLVKVVDKDKFLKDCENRPKKLPEAL